jgi:hypothetical protein
LVSSPRVSRRAPSERISIWYQEGYIKAKFFMLPLGGLHVKHMQGELPNKTLT